MLVICLIEKDVFPIACCRIDGIVFQGSILADSVFSTELFPELLSHRVAIIVMARVSLTNSEPLAGAGDELDCSYSPALAGLDGDEFTRHDCMLRCQSVSQSAAAVASKC